jgi:uncharacterized protein YgbK (DUF1537 family)
MTNEEFERKMEFIVNQQAQFSVGIQQLREAQAQTEQLINRLAAATFEGFRDVNVKIDALVDSHIRLQESQARTDENLRNLIAVVDRYFKGKNDGNGDELPG